MLIELYPALLHKYTLLYIKMTDEIVQVECENLTTQTGLIANIQAHKPCLRNDRYITPWSHTWCYVQHNKPPLTWVGDKSYGGTRTTEMSLEHMYATLA